jgi:PadR family transcriptional regulator PadR
MSKPTDLVQGTLDLLILRVISNEPMHGWAIAPRIRQMSNEVLQVGQGSLYPALHKLEQQGWIQAEWGESENNRRAKYYSLTRAGRKALAQEAAHRRRSTLFPIVSRSNRGRSISTSDPHGRPRSSCRRFGRLSAGSIAPCRSRTSARWRIRLLTPSRSTG